MKTFLIGILFLFSACAVNKTITGKPVNTAIADGKLFASVFQQTAAEYKALCFQAYNTARFRLDQHTNLRGVKPRAIITDIDETVLDNSAYDVQQVLQGKDYETESWKAWTARGEADTVPGAPGFLHYAASKGITIFYITNRYEEERAGTLKNLLRFQLPFADNEHLVMRVKEGSKEERRNRISENFEVILLIGDNLADFSDAFDKRTVEERNESARQLADLFGDRFIIIPNPVYGDWESAWYRYDHNLSLQQRDSILRKAVKGPR